MALISGASFFLSYFKSCDLDFAPFSRKNAKTVRIVIILFKALLKGGGFKTHREKKRNTHCKSCSSSRIYSNFFRGQ